MAAPPLAVELAPLIAAVEHVATADEAVRFVYLFGSRARGTGGARSDIDLAVARASEPDLMADARLHDALAAALGTDAVDVLLLLRAPLWLQFRVVGEGVVLYSRDERERIAFREDVTHRFLDFRPYYDEYLAHVRDRARRGVLSGG